MKRWFLLLLTFAFMASCAPQRMPLPAIPKPPPKPMAKVKEQYSTVREQSYRTRQPIPTKKSRYEGSLWENEASWGNLLRDHRARFKGDVLTIVNLAEIISIPKAKPKIQPKPKPKQVNQSEKNAAQINQTLDAISDATGIGKEEEEQNEVLGGIKSISARVARVLPNGNMVVIGEKVDYRRQNSVRYVTQIQGVIRPEDVTDQNEITAIKMARSEVKIKRQVMARKVNYRGLGPVIGAEKAGTLDKLSHMLNPPMPTSKVK